MNERKLNCKMWATKTNKNKWKSKNFLLAPFRGFLSNSINRNVSTERIIGELLRIMRASSVYTVTSFGSGVCQFVTRRLLWCYGIEGLVFKITVLSPLGTLLPGGEPPLPYLFWVSCLPVWYQAVLIVYWNWRTGVQNRCFLLVQRGCWWPQLVNIIS